MKPAILQIAVGQMANFTYIVSDGETIEIGGSISLRVLHTPGHSKDSICLLLDDQFIFTGDTLFVGNCGRVDLPGSDAKEIYYSLFDKLAKLDEKLILYPGHNYGPTSTSTIGHEKKTNYMLQPRSKQEFLEFIAAGE